MWSMSSHYLDTYWYTVTKCNRVQKMHLKSHTASSISLVFDGHHRRLQRPPSVFREARLCVWLSQYPFCRLTFWLVKGGFNSKRGERVTMVVSTETWGEKNKSTHWFDSHGFPTPFPWINPGLISIQKDKYKQIRAATVIEESRLQRLNSKEEQWEERRKEKINHQSVLGLSRPLCLAVFICAPLLGRSTTPWVCWLSSTSRSPAPGRRNRSRPKRRIIHFILFIHVNCWITLVESSGTKLTVNWLLAVGM